MDGATALGAAAATQQASHGSPYRVRRHDPILPKPASAGCSPSGWCQFCSHPSPSTPSLFQLTFPPSPTSKQWLSLKPPSRPCLPPSSTPPTNTASLFAIAAAPLLASLSAVHPLLSYYRKVIPVRASTVEMPLAAPWHCSTEGRECQVYWNHTSPSHLFPLKSLGGVCCCL